MFMFELLEFYLELAILLVYVSVFLFLLPEQPLQFALGLFLSVGIVHFVQHAVFKSGDFEDKLLSGALCEFKFLLFCAEFRN